MSPTDRVVRQSKPWLEALKALLQSKASITCRRNADPRQAEDRAHRIGQEAQSVLIQTLVFDLSVDANLARLMKRKVEISEMALDGRRATL